MHFWKSQIGILKQNCSHSLEDINSIFIIKVKKFYIAKDANAKIKSSNQNVNKPKNVTLIQFNNELFCMVKKSSEQEDKITRYLQQDIEPKETNILAYWLCRQQKFPTLSTMAHCYLGVLVTSAPLEQVFSKGRHITA